MSGINLCVLIPTYDNPATIKQVVAAAYQILPAVIVVNDGSGPQARSLAPHHPFRRLARQTRRRRPWRDGQTRWPATSLLGRGRRIRAEYRSQRWLRTRTRRWPTVLGHRPMDPLPSC